MLSKEKEYATMDNLHEISTRRANGLFTPLTPQQVKLRPYDFYKNYIGQIAAEAQRTYSKKDGYFAQVLYNSLESSHVVEIDQRLVQLIEGTSNDTDFYRPLFFRNIFINTEFHIGTDWILKGIELQDRGSDWLMSSFLIYKPIGTGQYVVNLLLDDKTFDFGDASLNKIINTVTKHIRTMCCNIVDLVENTDEDIEITKTVPSKEQQEKRKRRDKLPLPTKIFIKPKQHFIEYLSHISSHAPTSHKFEVMGHWRHYRNEKYTEKRREKPQWIKEHWKGEGIRVAKKTYKIVPGENQTGEIKSD